MTAKFVDFLSKKGVEDLKQEEGFVFFKYNKFSYMYQYDEKDDPYYFRIMLPNIESPVTDEIRKKMVTLSTKFKVVKLTEMNNQVWITMEQFVYCFDNLDKLFERMIEVLETAIKEYRK
jgi:hypothetical protein